MIEFWYVKPEARSFRFIVTDPFEELTLGETITAFLLGFNALQISGSAFW